MRITEIRYEHKVPVAQYESETLSAVAMLSDADHTEGAIVALKKLVNKGLNRVEVKEEPKKEEPKSEETKAAEPKKEEIKEEPPKADKEKPKKKAAKKKAPSKPKHTVYDRAEESHKKELGLYLNSEFPGWEEDASKAAALSKAMDGVTPLYDAKGDIMQEFKDAVAEGMK